MHEARRNGDAFLWVLRMKMAYRSNLMDELASIPSDEVAGRVAAYGRVNGSKGCQSKMLLGGRSFAPMTH